MIVLLLLDWLRMFEKKEKKRTNKKIKWNNEKALREENKQKIEWNNEIYIIKIKNKENKQKQRRKHTFNIKDFSKINDWDDGNSGTKRRILIEHFPAASQVCPPNFEELKSKTENMTLEADVRSNDMFSCSPCPGHVYKNLETITLCKIFWKFNVSWSWWHPRAPGVDVILNYVAFFLGIWQRDFHEICGVSRVKDRRRLTGCLFFERTVDVNETVPFVTCTKGSFEPPFSLGIKS